jgi:hypothetical protein
MPASHPETDFFDQLRPGWKQQAGAPAVDMERLRLAAESELQQQHRRHRRATIGMTLSFMIAIPVVTWVFFKYDDHGPLFYGSIIAVNLLMIIMGVMMWLGVQSERSRSDLSSLAYIAQSIRKLRLRRFILLYAVPVYLIIMVIALCCYYTDLLAEASLLMNLGAYGGTIAYVLIVYLFTRKKNRKKLEETSRLLEGLEQLSAGLQKDE